MKMRTVGYHLSVTNRLCVNCGQIVTDENKYCAMNVVSETEINFPRFSSIVNNVILYFKKKKYKKL